MQKLFAIAAILATTQAVLLQRELPTKTAALSAYTQSEFTTSTEEDNFKREVEQAKVASAKFQAEQKIIDSEKKETSPRPETLGKVMADGLIHASNGEEFF